MKFGLVALLISFFISTTVAVTYSDLSQFPGEECNRDCNNVQPRICYFDWHLEHYHTMGPACRLCLINTTQANFFDCFLSQCVTADGFERGIMTINRQIPGPPIHVCKGDRIVVDVTNKMGGETSTIHWHGFHQRETPYMDGVPFITQCPIDFATKFRYDFTATEAGTQFYHSHTGHHKVNGHYGGIVVRRPDCDDPNSAFYHYDLPEHLIVVSDWMQNTGEMFMPGLVSHGITPTNLLINGKGVSIRPDRRPAYLTPLSVFKVTPGKRHRFRVVNSVSHVCPIQIEIQKHRLTVIASDSFDLQPVTVDNLVMNSGERYDFVLDANQKPGVDRDFWIRVRALGSCDSLEIEQFAILVYEPALKSDIFLSMPPSKFPKYNRTFTSDATFLNHPNTTCGLADKKRFCITDLFSYTEDLKVTSGIPDHQFYLSFSNKRQKFEDVFGTGKYDHFMALSRDVFLIGAINNISFTFPPFSLLTQPGQIDESMFCDETHLPDNCKNVETCLCIHRLKIRKDALVELIIVDEASTINRVNHPFHVHGTAMRVMAMGQDPDMNPLTLKSTAELLKTRAESLTSDKTRFPIKDTISIPSMGYTVLRFIADNPGWWLLHCHFEWHLAVGMGLVLQVGERKDWVKPPPNFPRCNSYTPSVEF